MVFRRKVRSAAGATRPHEPHAGQRPTSPGWDWIRRTDSGAAPPVADRSAWRRRGRRAAAAATMSAMARGATLAVTEITPAGADADGLARREIVAAQYAELRRRRLPTSSRTRAASPTASLMPTICGTRDSRATVGRQHVHGGSPRHVVEQHGNARALRRPPRNAGTILPASAARRRAWRPAARRRRSGAGKFARARSTAAGGVAGAGVRDEQRALADDLRRARFSSSREFGIA